MTAATTELAFRAAGEQVRHDAYVHLTVTESSDPDLVRQAWSLQGTEYRDHDFVDDSAVTDEGFLIPELVSSHGELTDYRVALYRGSNKVAATASEARIPAGGDCTDLPTYPSCEQALTLDGITFLKNLDAPDVRLKEIAAVAGSPQAIYEIIREMVHGAQDKDEVWFFSIVSASYEKFASSFGHRNFTIIGDTFKLPDDRAKVDLVPAIMLPNRFIDNVLADYREADTLKTKLALLRSFMFFTEGLDETAMSPETYAARQEFLRARAARSGK